MSYIHTSKPYHTSKILETLIKQKHYPFLKGGGEMGELTRNYDWSSTPVGSPDTWPSCLRITVSNLLRSNFPMFLWWGEQMTQFYNNAYRPSLGNEGKHPTALGQNGRACWPEIWDIIYPEILQVQSTGEATWKEDQLIPIFRNGKIEDVYWTYSYSSVLDDEGKQAGILVTCTETTEKVLNAKRLEKSINNLHNIILEAPVAMCILSGPEHIVEIANERMFELWGKHRNEMIHKPLFEGLTEVKNQGFEELLHNVYTTGKTFTYYGMPVLLPRNGNIEMIYINFVYEAYREVDGSIAGIMVVANDVTEQVQASKKFEESEARFRLLADSMPQFVWSSDKEGNLNYFNQAVYDFALMNEKEIMEGGWKNILHPDEIEENINRWRTSVEKGENFLFHHRFKNKEGEYIWQLSRAVPLKDQDGKIQMWIGTSTNIHDDKLFEEKLQARIHEQTVELLMVNQQLRQFNADLARSNRHLEEFAYVASHDMKEPIRKVHFFTDKIQSLLADRFLQDELKYFERIKASANRMSHLIDDLLAYSQVSVRPGHFERISLDEVIKNVLNDLEVDIEQKNAKIHVEPLGEIKGHQGQLHQAFQNLLANAIKFQKPGEDPVVHINCELVHGDQIGIVSNLQDLAKNYYKIEVTDNGIGFDPQEAARIFNVFTRLHGNSEYQGTGIGLSIVKKVIENHNGYIFSKSEMGNGACFVLYLPVV